MSAEDKYAAPPPGYDDATKLPGDKPVSSVPLAGVTPTATTQPQPQGNGAFTDFNTLRYDFSLI